MRLTEWLTAETNHLQIANGVSKYMGQLQILKMVEHRIDLP
ncbi:hypothetical protein XaFJ1_GM002129 [Xanthomonas albilineans]|nr:hypothetical protein XaFJ1_GM002129 [Xanthomonas albilineans]